MAKKAHCHGFADPFSNLSLPATFFLSATFEVCLAHKGLIKSSTFITLESGSQPQSEFIAAPKLGVARRFLNYADT